MIMIAFTIFVKCIAFPLDFNNFSFNNAFTRFDLIHAPENDGPVDKMFEELLLGNGMWIGILWKC